MDLHNQHKDDEVLDRLLQEYLLEEEDNAAVQQSLDILSGSVFQQEAVLEPGIAREKSLEQIKKGKNGFGFGLNGFTFSLSILLLLLLVGTIVLLLPFKKTSTADAVTNPGSEITGEQEHPVAITSTSLLNEEEVNKNDEGNFFQQAVNDAKEFFSIPDEPVNAQVENHDRATDFKLLREKISAINSNIPKDRLYLRSDKTLYKTGERIWLSVYVRDAATLEQSQMSDVVYVHLINPKNQVEKSIRLIAQDGIAAGDFLLDDHFPGGIYKLKTYTNWQKNEPGFRFFEKEIQVQQLVDSDLSLKLEFEKEQFSKDEKIKATVKFRNVKGEPVKDFSFQCIVTLAGENKLEFEKKTNEAGNASIEFKLPEQSDIRKGFLNFYFEYKGNTEYLSEQIPMKSSGLKFEFYPEGGQLVEGIESRVAFQALDGVGNPIAIDGMVHDNDGHEVLSFASVHDGMGFFYLNPEAGKTYKATVTNNIDETTFTLPPAITKGFVLQVDSITHNHVQLSVKASTASQILLSAIQRDKLCYLQEHKIFTGVNKISIPVTQLPMGVLQITLFDEKNIPQAERLVFINPHKKLNIELQTNQTTFALHEKVTMSATVRNEKGEPQPAHLSLSVTNEHLLGDNPLASNGIFSALYINPDLEENILNGECYFTALNNCDARELDLLMLTKGWRKFSWEEIATQQPAQYANEKALVAGRIMHPVSGRPMEGVEVALPGKGKVVTDAKGYFSFAQLNLESRMEMTLTLGKETMSYFINEYDDDLEIIFYGDGKKIYQPEEKGIRHPLVKALRKASDESAILLGKVVSKNYEPLTGASVQLLKDGTPVATTSTDKNGFYQLETGMSGVFSLLVAHRDYREHSYSGYKMEAGKALLLDILLTDEKLTDDAAEKASALASLGNTYPVKIPALKTTELNLSSGVNFEKVLQGFSDVYHLDETGNLYLKEFQDKNNIYVDGLKLEYNQPVSISKTNIEEIRVYDSDDAAFAQEESDYIVEIKTTGEETLAAHKKEPYVARYYRAKEFPRIQYNPEKNEPVGNDFRTTLYWNPKLQAGTSGEASTEFFTSDVPGRYKVLVEGISADGKAGYAELIFEVKE